MVSIQGRWRSDPAVIVNTDGAYASSKQPLSDDFVGNDINCPIQESRDENPHQPFMAKIQNCFNITHEMFLKIQKKIN